MFARANYSYAAWYMRLAGKLFLINFYDLKLYSTCPDAIQGGSGGGLLIIKNRKQLDVPPKRWSEQSSVVTTKDF